ncbi:hypothetical protein [Vulcanisaeta thermophila]|uniref:hypothetical protein n=1 Tax=Vulcanisaeta thermophila TaxID=867917 RepID=UPI000852EF46|nr:hypothetical protein [Vulcanisaeta thermophila]
MNTKLLMAVAISIATFLWNHTAYLVIVNTVVPLILINDFIRNLRSLRIFINDGEAVSKASIGLGGYRD